MMLESLNVHQLLKIEFIDFITFSKQFNNFWTEYFDDIGNISFFRRFYFVKF